jgi:hypothetical protein
VGQAVGPIDVGGSTRRDGDGHDTDDTMMNETTERPAGGLRVAGLTVGG